MTEKNPNRRTLLRTVGTGAVLSVLPTSVSASRDNDSNEAERVTDLSFDYRGYAFDVESQDYSPDNEFIFPSIIETSNLENALGKYYLYCSPHGTGSTKDGESVGIALFYSDSLDNNSWTEHPDNPLIPPEWGPHYDVSHISSPHAIWMDEYEELFIYFHGENSTTHWATSKDGVEFSYGGVAVDNSMYKGSSETSYARVYDYSIPNRNNRYVMFFMDNQSGTRHIRLAVSKDAKDWSVDPDEVITPQNHHEGNVSGPFFFKYRGNYYLAFHGSSNKIYVAELGRNLHKEKYLGVFAEAPSDEIRLAEPFLIKDESGTPWMYFNRGGGRLTSSIAYRKLTDPEDAKHIDLFDPSK